jgi:capsular exopolysaccharide synthesis family protein
MHDMIVEPVAGVPLRKIVPRRLTDHPHLVMQNRPESPVAERYRRIQLHLEQGTREFPHPPQLTVITSAVPGEGKTTTAMNLALTYAENRNRRTLLVGADLRRPSVSGYVTPKPTCGLSEVLVGEAPLDHALIELSDSKLWILPSGAPREMPLRLLQTKQLGSLVAELRRRFDHILIDTPPTVPFTDAAVLASHADGALLVVRAGTTTNHLIRRAIESLSGARLLGVVLNDIVFSAVDRYYNRYDEYQPERYADARRQEASA